MSMDVRGGRGVPHLRVRRAPRYRVHRSEEHTSELQSQSNLVCRLLLEKKKVIFSIMTEQKGFATSRVGRIYTAESPHVMQLLSLNEPCISLDSHRVAKIGSSSDQDIYR